MPGRNRVPSFQLASGTTDERDGSYNLTTLGTLGSIFYNTDTSNVEIRHEDPSNNVGWRDLVMNNKEQIDISGMLVVDGDVSFNAHLSVLDASFLKDVTVVGNLYVDGSFNFGEVIKNITTVNNELLISTQVDISNHGTGPALKVSQYGDGADDKLAVFDAGEQGVAFEIMYDGDSVFHKDVSFQNNVDISGNIKLTGGYITRSNYHTGCLMGGHNYGDLSNSESKTNPIYTIGPSYIPDSNGNSLSDMYGIGYTKGASTTFASSVLSGWGMYVASDGDARIGLDGQYGNIKCTGYIQSSYIGRTQHHTGFLVGGHNNVGASDYKISPIYSIGTNYLPESDVSLSNMYGVGYGRGTAEELGILKTTGNGGQLSGWGLWVAADGDARIGLNASHGQIRCTGHFECGEVAFFDVTANTTFCAVRCKGTATQRSIKFTNVLAGVTNYSTRSNICSVYAYSFPLFSDDRIKKNEKLIVDATKTLQKLTPQIYDKYGSMDLSGDFMIESGLIAQEVYYNAPELRHIVCLGEQEVTTVNYVTDASINDVTDASDKYSKDLSGNYVKDVDGEYVRKTTTSGFTPTPEEMDISDIDIGKDPDYGSHGWSTTESSSVNYTGLIPYLIKATQELVERIDLLETENTQLKTENTEQKGQIIQLTTDISLIRNHIGI